MKFIQSIFKFLNDNAGAITAIATALLTIFTARYVYLTRNLVKEAKRQVDLILNERKIQFHRELVEKVYVPLKNAIVPLSECLLVENPLPFNEWRTIKAKTPFLAYRIDKNLYEELDDLLEIHYVCFSSYGEHRKTLNDIIRETFPEVPFSFIYNKETITYLSPLLFIFSRTEPKELIKGIFEIMLHSQKIDEGLIECRYPYKAVGVKIEEFINLWHQTENKIRSNVELSNWLKSKEELESKANQIRVTLEKLIKNNV